MSDSPRFECEDFHDLPFDFGDHDPSFEALLAWTVQEIPEWCPQPRRPRTCACSLLDEVQLCSIAKYQKMEKYDIAVWSRYAPFWYHSPPDEGCIEQEHHKTESCHGHEKADGGKQEKCPPFDGAHVRRRQGDRRRERDQVGIVCDAPSRPRHARRERGELRLPFRRHRCNPRTGRSIRGTTRRDDRLAHLAPPADSPVRDGGIAAALRFPAPSSRPRRAQGQDHHGPAVGIGPARGVARPGGPETP